MSGSVLILVDDIYLDFDSLDAASSSGRGVSFPSWCFQQILTISCADIAR